MSRLYQFIFRFFFLITILHTSSHKSYAQDWSFKKAPLMTKWDKDINIKKPLPEYPRPQMVRSEWMNLNGLWDFRPGTENEKVPQGEKFLKKILVPFPVESALSGVMEHHERLWYRKEFSIPDGWEGKKIIIHFGAIDWESEVFINGKSVGMHQGGYDEISYDITPYLHNSEQQELLVRVYDPTEKAGIPRGKQENPPHGNLIMYTPVTGIWQTVWLEPVHPLSHIDHLKLLPDVDNKRLKINVFASGSSSDVMFKAIVKEGEKEIATIKGLVNKSYDINLNLPKLWSPESPFLYSLEVKLIKGQTELDDVDSYFGMRKISIEKVGDHRKIFLNNKFCYHFGFLDQGFWPDGIYTAPTDEALKFDVQIQKDLGYNMVRKHLKVEPLRWYYWADKLGLMVWQDMPSANSYKHNPPSVDTAQYRKELQQMIDGRFNSPAIVTWVLFNETQGQKASDGTNLTQRMVDVVRTMDNSRLINPASDNIYKDYIGDILDYHSYPGPKPIENKNMATACGEFGSLGLAVKGHEWVPDSGVSMVMLKNPKQLEDTYEQYVNMLSEYKYTQGMSGAVFTQLTDVEQELNGFLTYDRVPKVAIAKIKRINQRLIGQSIRKQVILGDARTKAETWRYRISEPDKTWKELNFDDSDWKAGEAGFGNGSPPNSNIRTAWSNKDIWLRKELTLDHMNVDDLKNLYFDIYHDEDYEIYINGELAASGKGNSVNYITVPVDDHAKAAWKIYGKNVIAVHCTQTTGGQYIDVGLSKISYEKD